MQEIQEKRREQRWPAYLGGRASFFDQQANADCLIRNTSGAGALLRIGNGQFVPNEFELVIPQRDIAYRARTCWRSSDEVGVELLAASNATDASATPSLIERLKRAESKNRKLKRRLAELSQ